MARGAAESTSCRAKTMMPEEPKYFTCGPCITRRQPKRRFLVTPARAIAHTFHNTYPADILHTHTGRMTRAILPKDDTHTSPAICNAEK